MKFSRLERCVVLLLAVFVAFLAGWTVSDRTMAESFTVRTETAAGPEAPLPRADGLSGPALLNLNTASQEELEALPEIGPTRAQAIIAYRDENGPFAYLEELIDVPGIGESTLESVLDYLTVEEAAET